ncbi:MAG: cytochrome c biogenesis protein CcdA [bacterium]
MPPGLQEVPGYFTSFTAGLLSFLTPCVLPLVPGYISYISGVSLAEMEGSGEDRDKLKRTLPVLYCTLAFIVGFTAVFIAGGVTAYALGEAISSHKDILMRVAGVVVIVLGLHMAGAFRIKSLEREWRFQGGKSGSILGAFVLGLAFAFGWSPCLGPILGSILLMAMNQETANQAIVLMALYSVGLAIPFVLTGLAVDTFFKFFDQVKNHFRKIEIGAGVLLILVGALMLLGQFELLRLLFNWIFEQGREFFYLVFPQSTAWL